MQKVLWTDTLVTGKFTASIDQPVKADSFMFEMAGVGGATAGVAPLISQMGRGTLRKRGDVIWDFDFKHLRWLDQFLYGNPYYTSGTAANQVYNLNIKIPCGWGDGNVMDIRKEDNAVFEFTINSSFPITIGATGWASNPTWTFLANTREGVSGYDLKILTPSESIGASQNKPIVMSYENILGLFAYDATATDSDTGVGGTAPDMGQANHINRIKARVGSLDADQTIREALNATNWDGRLEGNLTSLAKVFMCRGDNLAEMLNDAIEITILNGSTAIVADFLVISAKMNPHKLDATTNELNAQLASRKAAKQALGQTYNVAVINKAIAPKASAAGSSGPVS